MSAPAATSGLAAMGGRSRPVGSQSPTATGGSRLQPGAVPTPTGRRGRERLILSGELAKHFLTSLVDRQGFAPRWPALGLGLPYGSAWPLRLSLAGRPDRFVAADPPSGLPAEFLVCRPRARPRDLLHRVHYVFPISSPSRPSCARSTWGCLRAAASLGASRADLVRRGMLPSAARSSSSPCASASAALVRDLRAEFMGADAGSAT